MNEYTQYLVEVEFPIPRISDDAQPEKSVQNGHVSSLHVYGGQRSLAGCWAGEGALK
jgi:adenine-specific DNA methylase